MLSNVGVKSTEKEDLIILGRNGKKSFADELSRSVRDQEYLIEVKEVQEALTNVLKTPVGNRKVINLGPNRQ